MIETGTRRDCINGVFLDIRFDLDIRPDLDRVIMSLVYVTSVSWSSIFLRGSFVTRETNWHIS